MRLVEEGGGGGLRSKTNELMIYFRIKDKSVYRVDYAQYEKDKSLKGEFIRTVMEKEELSAEEKAAIIHYGMQALAGEEIGEA